MIAFVCFSSMASLPTLSIHCLYQMLPLNHKRTTSSLVPPLFYLAKNSAIKRQKVPHWIWQNRPLKYYLKSIKLPVLSEPVSRAQVLEIPGWVLHQPLQDRRAYRPVFHFTDPFYGECSEKLDCFTNILNSKMVQLLGIVAIK